MQYVELHARSAFTFLEGSSLPETLMQACANYGMPAMALLDRDGVYGAPRFHLMAKELGLKAHIGAEISVNSENRSFFQKSFFRKPPFISKVAGRIPKSLPADQQGKIAGEETRGGACIL